MDCTEFLERYSDFRDGLVTALRERRRFERHLGRCAQCREHDARVRRGVMALQTARTIQPSPDFRRRLEARLSRERAKPALSLRAGIAAALFVAVALALLAHESIVARHTDSARARALPAAPFPKPVMQAGPPHVVFQDPRVSVVMGNPHPYGTALVEPASAGR